MIKQYSFGICALPCFGLTHKPLVAWRRSSWVGSCIAAPSVSCVVLWCCGAAGKVCFRLRKQTSETTKFLKLFIWVRGRSVQSLFPAPSQFSERSTVKDYEYFMAAWFWSATHHIYLILHFTPENEKCPSKEEDKGVLRAAFRKVYKVCYSLERLFCIEITHLFFLFHAYVFL